VLPDFDTIAFRLRLSEDKALDVVTNLAVLGLLDKQSDGSFAPHNWNKRQYDKPSDTPERVSARVKKHRNADVTPLKRAETPLYTDTDTDTEADTEQKQTPPAPQEGEYPPEFEDFWRRYPKGHGSRLKSYQAWRKVKGDHVAIMAGLEEWHRSERWQKGMIKTAELWLRDRLWENPAPPGLLLNGTHGTEEENLKRGGYHIRAADQLRAQGHDL
jgi:hypothetical protein